jgi:hypothetical protein
MWPEFGDEFGHVGPRATSAWGLIASCATTSGLPSAVESWTLFFTARKTLMKMRQTFIVGPMIALAFSTNVARSADDFPTRPITLIVPFAAGGLNDVLGRIVTDHMAKTLGQSILIENVSGAGGTTGSARAKAAPDGYTMVSGNLGSHGASYAYYSKLGYEPRNSRA